MMTCASMPRVCSHRASQKPFRSASNADATRSTGMPAASASNRLRVIIPSNASGSRIELLEGESLNSERDSSYQPAILNHFYNDENFAGLIQYRYCAADIFDFGHDSLCFGLIVRRWSTSRLPA